ncbi:MAG: YceD family protein [Candidatus Nanopelagicales bacterium]
MSTLDPRKGLVLDIRALGRRAGSMLPVERNVPAPADLGAGLAVVEPGSQMGLSIRLESVVEGVLVSGTVSVTVHAECARCLEPVEWDQTVAFSELFVYEPRPGEEEFPVLEGDLLDLEPVVRDAVVLALPLAPLCSADCPGLCVQCGARLAGDPGHVHDVMDPRWAGLAGYGND